MNFEGIFWDILFLFILLEICMLVIDRLLRGALNLPSGEEE
tara:strand:- start:170 stop:292 length:123 start_codon:yes stop_codon:yes gene_type:complete